MVCSELPETPRQWGGQIPVIPATRLEVFQSFATCAIFGESELISKIAEGVSLQEIAAGVNYSIFTRIKPLLKRLPSEVVVFCGGVAKNLAIAQLINEELGQEVIVLPLPQLNGALGAAYLAL